MTKRTRVFLKKPGTLLISSILICIFILAPVGSGAEPPRAAVNPAAEDTVLRPEPPAVPEDQVPEEHFSAAPEQALPRNKAAHLPVLVYHHLAPAEYNLHRNNPMILPVETFRQQMQYLKKHNYYTPTLTEVEAYVSGKLDLPANSVLITFDDGYESNYQYAHPILADLGLTAVVFIIGTDTRPGEDENFNPAVVTYLSWEQITAMSNSNVWEIGSHTYHGHKKDADIPALLTWSTEEASADFTALNDRFAVESLSKPTAIAYPYGAYNSVVLSAASHSGCRLGFTVEPGWVRPGDASLQLPRQGVFPWHTVEQFAKLLQ